MDSVIDALEKALKHADEDDKFNGFGEGYASLRAAVEKAIAEHKHGPDIIIHNLSGEKVSVQRKQQLIFSVGEDKA